jgi:hypothetical protein
MRPAWAGNARFFNPSSWRAAIFYFIASAAVGAPVFFTKA